MVQIAISSSNNSDSNDVKSVKQSDDDDKYYLKKYKKHKTIIPEENGNYPNIKIDEQISQFWYYAVTKSFREYQFHIVETCLFNNTMVCLPTGLGKTFIAAITILNYYLWYPDGKIFFLAPTRPLVGQQIDSLQAFKSIDQNDIIELTGQTSQDLRKRFYKTKKIFFMTPQSLQNDLEQKRYSGNDISLIVFDEAHHGTGKYSYTQIINYLENQGYGYRILALSATPGNTKETIKEVIQNMKVSRLEVKDDDDPDVKKYIFEKDVEPVVIKSNFELTSLSDALNRVIKIPYDWLCKVQIVPPKVMKQIKTPAQIGRGSFYQIFKHFQDNIQDFNLKLGPSTIECAYQRIKVFSQLAHGKNTLSTQSFDCFGNWLKEFKASAIDEKTKKINKTKQDLLKTQEFEQFLKIAEQNLENNDTSCMQEEQEDPGDGLDAVNAPNLYNPKQSKKIHPKTLKLLDILTDFYNEPENQEKKSKVMIFTQNRNNVQVLFKFFEKNDNGGTIKPAIFIGQATKSGSDLGMNQKQQKQNIEKFKNDVYNVLIATCIGEEGLDIGEVDLIICYDSGFSPIRMIQRMGRTGRKREGKVKILLMEGKEHNNYKQSQKESKKLKKFLKECANYQKTKLKAKDPAKFSKPTYELGYYSFNPRMIPEEINPKIKFLDNDDHNNEIKEVNKDLEQSQKKTKNTKNTKDKNDNFIKANNKKIPKPNKKNKDFAQSLIDSVNLSNNSINIESHELERINSDKQLQNKKQSQQNLQIDEELMDKYEQSFEKLINSEKKLSPEQNSQENIQQNQNSQKKQNSSQNSQKKQENQQKNVKQSKTLEELIKESIQIDKQLEEKFKNKDLTPPKSSSSNTDEQQVLLQQEKYKKQQKQMYENIQTGSQFINECLLSALKNDNNSSIDKENQTKQSIQKTQNVNSTKNSEYDQNLKKICSQNIQNSLNKSNLDQLNDDCYEILSTDQDEEIEQQQIIISSSNNNLEIKQNNNSNSNSDEKINDKIQKVTENQNIQEIQNKENNFISNNNNSQLIQQNKLQFLLNNQESDSESDSDNDNFQNINQIIQNNKNQTIKNKNINQDIFDINNINKNKQFLEDNINNNQMEVESHQDIDNIDQQQQQLMVNDEENQQNQQNEKILNNIYFEDTSSSDFSEGKLEYILEKAQNIPENIKKIKKSDEYSDYNDDEEDFNKINNPLKNNSNNSIINNNLDSIDFDQFDKKFGNILNSQQNNQNQDQNQQQFIIQEQSTSLEQQNTESTYLKQFWTEGLSYVIPEYLVLIGFMFIFIWWPKYNKINVINCISLLGWVLGIVFFSVYFAVYYEIMKIDFFKIKGPIELINLDLIQLKQNQYYYGVLKIKLDNQVDSIDQKHMYGYGCIEQDHSQINYRYGSEWSYINKLTYVEADCEHLDQELHQFQFDLTHNTEKNTLNKEIPQVNIQQDTNNSEQECSRPYQFSEIKLPSVYCMEIDIKILQNLFIVKNYLKQNEEQNQQNNDNNQDQENQLNDQIDITYEQALQIQENAKIQLYQQLKKEENQKHKFYNIYGQEDIENIETNDKDIDFLKQNSFLQVSFKDPNIERSDDYLLLWVMGSYVPFLLFSFQSLFLLITIILELKKLKQKIIQKQQEIELKSDMQTSSKQMQPINQQIQEQKMSNIDDIYQSKDEQYIGTQTQIEKKQLQKQNSQISNNDYQNINPDKNIIPNNYSNNNNNIIQQQEYNEIQKIQSNNQIILDNYDNNSQIINTYKNQNSDKKQFNSNQQDQNICQINDIHLQNNENCSELNLSGSQYHSTKKKKLKDDQRSIQSSEFNNHQTHKI